MKIPRCPQYTVTVGAIVVIFRNKYLCMVMLHDALIFFLHRILKTTFDKLVKLPLRNVIEKEWGRGKLIVIWRFIFSTVLIYFVTVTFESTVRYKIVARMLMIKMVHENRIQSTSAIWILHGSDGKVWDFPENRREGLRKQFEMAKGWDKKGFRDSGCLL